MLKERKQFNATFLLSCVMHIAIGRKRTVIFSVSLKIAQCTMIDVAFILFDKIIRCPPTISHSILHHLLVQCPLIRANTGAESHILVLHHFEKNQWLGA